VGPVPERSCWRPLRGEFGECNYEGEGRKNRREVSGLGPPRRLFFMDIRLRGPSQTLGKEFPSSGALPVAVLTLARLRIRRRQLAANFQGWMGMQLLAEGTLPVNKTIPKLVLCFGPRKWGRENLWNEVFAESEAGKALSYQFLPAGCRGAITRVFSRGDRHFRKAAQTKVPTRHMAKALEARRTIQWPGWWPGHFLDIFWSSNPLLGGPHPSPVDDGDRGLPSHS